MATPHFDEIAKQTDEAAWNRWLRLPDDEALLLTKRELAAMLEAMLALSEAIRSQTGGAKDADPVRPLVRSILEVSDRKIVIDSGIDGGEY